MMAPRTLFEKAWQDHVIREPEGEPALLYIDLHLVHEVTSPQPFESLRLTGRKVRRPELTIATADHNVATTDRSLPVEDPISRQQLEALDRNCAEFGLRLEGALSPMMGIVHVIEYTGSAIRALSMEGRMTVSNMSIEGGGRVGIIAPDDKTFKYIEGRPHAPKGKQWEQALDYWRSLKTDEGAVYDK